MSKVALALSVIAILAVGVLYYFQDQIKKDVDANKNQIVLLQQNANQNTSVSNKNANVNSNANKNANANVNVNTNSSAKSDAVLLQEAFVAKNGALAAGEEFTVSKNDGSFAKGMVGGEGGGGFWLAAKSGGVWTVIFEGQSNPECAILDQYNYPSSMMTTCTKNGDEVNR